MEAGMNYETMLRITSYLDLSSCSFLPSLGGKQGRHLVGWFRKNHSQTRSPLEIRIKSVLAHKLQTHVFTTLKYAVNALHSKTRQKWAFSSPSVWSSYVRYNTCTLHASYPAVLGLTTNRRVILLFFFVVSKFTHIHTEILTNLPWTFTSYRTTTVFTSSDIF